MAKPHAITVHTETEDESTYVSDVTFTCTASPTAECRTYPECECEGWPCDHPRVSGQECWLKGWFDAGLEATVYVGPDGTNSDGWGDLPGVPAIAKTGLIRLVEFDEGPHWEWA